MSRKTGHGRGLLRQGDLLLIPTDPDVVDGGIAVGDRRVVERADGRLVLAEGEATGHAHAVVEEHARLEGQGYGERRRNWNRWSWSDSRTVLIVEGSPASLVHEEHDSLTLAPGGYVVRRQREYAPAARERSTGAVGWRRVAD
jgi:hypothetical protein